MEPLTSLPSTRIPASPAGRRTEPPVLTTPGPTELGTAEIHEEGCFYCSLTEEPVDNGFSGGKAHPAAPPEPAHDEVPALEAPQLTALWEAKHTLQRLLNPPYHLPQEKTTPLDTTQPLLLALYTIDAPSQDSHSTAGDAQLAFCVERSGFTTSPTPVPPQTCSAPATPRATSAALHDLELCTATMPTLMVHLPLHGTFLQFFEPQLCVSVVYFHYSDRKHAPEGTPNTFERAGSRRENLRQGLRSRGRQPADAKSIQRPLIAETTAVFADLMGRRSRNKRISKRGKEISPPKDKHSYWVPADDDVNSDDQIVEGGPMRLATPSPNAAGTSASAHPAENEEEENSASAHPADNKQATPHRTPARTADVSDPQGDETEENSASAHPAENEEESAAAEDPAAKTDARTLSQLQQYIHHEHVQLQRARHNIPDAPHLPQIWPDAWKQSDDTKHLWQLFRQLQPVVASRQAEDLQRLYGDNTIAQSTSSTSQPDTSEPAASAEPMDESSVEAAVTDTSAVSASALDTSDTPSDLDYRTDQTRSPQYERISTPQHSSLPAQPEYVLPPPPPPPPRLADPRRPSATTAPAAPELDDILVDFRRPPTPSTLRTGVPHRNPSPPPTPVRPAVQHGEAVIETTRTAADMKRAHKTTDAEVAAAHPAANTSTSKGSGHSQKTTVRTVKKSGHTSAARDGTNSRSSTGSKRSRVSDGGSHPPPCKRIGSRSPTRKPSPSIARHVQRKKTSQHRNMVPVIDGCVYTDMAIDLAKGQHQPAAWQQEFDLPHNPYEMLGVINHLCVPSTNLPADVVIRHEATPLTPYVDQTFDQALLENTIIPWPYILGSTVGCAPTYWQQTGTKAREYLYKAADRRHLYRNKIKAVGIGPTGFDLRSGGHLITGEYAGQRENIVRYARIARNVRMPLVIHVEYDQLPEGVQNLHVEAIKALRDAELSSRHRIHLVAFKATALDLTLWLEEFPRTVISMDLDLLHGLNEALRINNGDDVFRHASALKKFFTHVPMANLGLHSGCPLSLTVPGTYRTPSMLLRAAQQFEQLTGTHGDHLHEHNAANLVAMYDLNPDLLDRSTNTKDLRDPAIGPRLTIRELSFTIRALYGAPPRVDLRGQGRTPSRRRSSIAEASPAAERMDTDEAPTTSHKKQPRSRSSASKSRREPSPPRRTGGRRHSPARRSRAEAPRLDPAHSAGDSQAKKAASKGLNPAHSAGGKPSKDRSAPTKPTTAKEGASAPAKTVPITCPPGSRLQGRLGSLLVPSSSPKPAAPSKLKTTQGFQPRQPDYTGPPKQVFLNMTQPAPERTEERRIVIRAPDPRFFKTQPVHEAVLPQEPTTVDICNHFEQYFHEEDPDAPLRKVYDGSLSTTAMPFTQGEHFDVPREPGRHPGPWDPTKTCRCRNVERELHQTTEEFGLITKKKWTNKDVIKADKTGNGLKQILDEAMQLEIQSFGQMIFLKYADRLIGNDFQAGWILRFMFEVLQTTDWPGLIDLLREFQKKMVPNESREPWPTHADVYAAAESWCCYCPEAYAYIYARLNGP
ncbi:hypothetical protein AAVH_32917, partial [Aphelenchoides avenae]